MSLMKRSVVLVWLLAGTVCIQGQPPASAEPPVNDEAANSPFALPDQPQKIELPAEGPSSLAAGAAAEPQSPFALETEPHQPSGMGVLPNSSAAPVTAGSPDRSSDEVFEQGLRLAQAGQYAEAEAAFSEAARLAPGNPKIWNNLGLALRKQRKLEAALDAYYQAVKISPAFALAYKNAGVVLEEMHEYQRAAKAYQNYCRYAPKAEDLSEVRQRAEWLERRK